MKQLLTQVSLAATFLLSSFASQANVVYNVSDAVTNCSGSSHGLWTNNSVGGGTCSNYFSINGTLDIDNTDATASNWTAKLLATATNPQSVVATVDIDFSGFVEDRAGYKTEGGRANNSWTDNSELANPLNDDVDFFENILGTIVIGGTNYTINGFAGGYGFQFGNGANAKSPTAFGASAWVFRDTGGRHWDFNLNLEPQITSVPAPALFTLFGLALIGLGYQRRNVK